MSFFFFFLEFLGQSGRRMDYVAKCPPTGTEMRYFCEQLGNVLTDVVFDARIRNVYCSPAACDIKSIPRLLLHPPHIHPRRLRPCLFVRRDACLFLLLLFTGRKKRWPLFSSSRSCCLSLSLSFFGRRRVELFVNDISSCQNRRRTRKGGRTDGRTGSI